MAYVTYGQIRSRPRIVAKAENSILRESADARGKRVFLAHSRLDKDLVAGVSDVLTEHDAPAYLDVNDTELPSTPSASTARILRARITQCPRFVLAASGNIRESRWAPWEL
jgi:hypothetical protein